MHKRLVVSDMDGTLLNSHQQISGRTKETLRRLAEKGVTFSAASGRSRRSLEALFGDIRFASISDNGATVYDDRGNLIWYREIPCEIIEPIWREIMKTDFLHPVLCGLKMHYVLASDTEEARKAADYFFNGYVETVKDLQEVYEKDKIVKLSLYTRPDGSDEQAGLEVVEPFREAFMITLPGGGWIDITRAGATKGTAYEKLCDSLAVNPEESMIFGDYLNDLEMLTRCPDSWCMKNGHPEVRKICAHITSYNNDEDGVARELSRIFEIE